MKWKGLALGAALACAMSVRMRGVDINVINPEAALVVGPFSLQGDYKHTFAPLPQTSDASVFGDDVLASRFLTGENRPYETERAAFDRVRPERNFLGKEGGWGASELAARHSDVALNSKSVEGGKLGDVTGGVNWCLNPNLHVTLNCVDADLEDVGDTHTGETRFPLAF